MRLSDKLAPQMPCKKLMNLEPHSRPLAKTYGSVAKKLRLVAKNLWFGIRTTDALQKSYEPRASFAATCKNSWYVAGILCLLAGSVRRVRDNTNHKNKHKFLQRVELQIFHNISVNLIVFAKTGPIRRSRDHGCASSCICVKMHRWC